MTERTKVTRREALKLFAAGGGLASFGALGGYLLRGFISGSATAARRASTSVARPRGRSKLTNDGMMGDRVDMSAYMDMLNRHDEIHRHVEHIPGGIRTVTESDAPDLATQIQQHLSKMYTALNEGAEVTCNSSSLPTLFRNADSYRRQFTTTAKGVIVSETSDDPEITRAIREHAGEVNLLVRDGMAAMMQTMMG